MDSARPEEEGYYLMSLNRSRSDGFTGLFGGLVRSKGQSETKKSLEAALGAARDVLERYAKETRSAADGR